MTHEAQTYPVTVSKGRREPICIVARVRPGTLGALARKRENPNWSLNLSFVTGLRQSTAAEKSPALEEIERLNNFYRAVFAECYLLRRTATFVPLAVVKGSERAS